MSDPLVTHQTFQGPRQLRATFPDQAALDAALELLRLRGFDRADLSLPTSGAQSDQPTTDIDRQQARTLGGSTAGVVAALGGAVITVATGGAAAAAVGVAAAAGLAAGGATHAAIAGSGETRKEEQQEAARKGELVLVVSVRDAALDQPAQDALREAGAIRIDGVGVDAA
jgi:hypothetical protein